MFRRVLLIAHRGYSSEAPENTFAAFDLAIERGYREIEFDVQLSGDGVPVIIHDETLDRTTNGSGRVADLTFDELSRLDAGAWRGPEFAGQRIPALMDFLVRYRGIANLHLEIKSTEPELPGILAGLLDVTGWKSDIERRPWHIWRRRPKLVISSEHRESLLYSIALLPHRTTHELVVENVSDESLHWAARHGMRSYHPDGNDITPELIRKARRLKLHVGGWWWTPEEQNVQSLARAGARYAYVDAPHRHRHGLLDDIQMTP